MHIHSRVLEEKDIEKMKSLLLRDGPNEWNFLTEDSIECQLKMVKNGSAIAMLAEEDEIL